MKRMGSLLPSDKGSASLEFALLLPLLILVLLAAIDFGRFAFSAIAVTNAARTGAAFCNYASLAASCSNSDLVKSEVIQAAAPYVTILNSQIVVTLPTCVTVSDPCRLKVQIAYPFSTLLPIPHQDGSGAWVWNKANVTIARSAQMRIGLN